MWRYFHIIVKPTATLIFLMESFMKCTLAQPGIIFLVVVGISSVLICRWFSYHFIKGYFYKCFSFLPGSDIIHLFILVSSSDSSSSSSLSFSFSLLSISPPPPLFILPAPLLFHLTIKPGWNSYFCLRFQSAWIRVICHHACLGQLLINESSWCPEIHPSCVPLHQTNFDVLYFQCCLNFSVYFSFNHW